MVGNGTVWGLELASVKSHTLMTWTCGMRPVGMPGLSLCTLARPQHQMVQRTSSVVSFSFFQSA